MSKIIFWIVVFFAILLVLRLVSIAKTKSDREPRRDPPKAIPPAEPTVRCVDCGVFLPKAEASPAPTGSRCCRDFCFARFASRSANSTTKKTTIQKMILPMRTDARAPCRGS